jgi:hypothetical protein
MDTPPDDTPKQAIAGETQRRPFSFVSKFEAWTESFSSLLDRRTTWLLAALLLLYIAATVPLACLKFMWLDELFTYSIAGLPSANRIWFALASRVGPMPPTFYFVTRFTQNVLGPSHFAIRLPELTGFWMASLCLFHYVRRRTDALYGLAGVLALWITGAYRYAYEARPYGLVLGFCGLALVCWQAASERVHRRRALLGLFGALAGAVFSHYGGVMLLFPLGLGELVRSISRRKVDWPVWLSFCGALVPLLLFLPLLGGSISSYGVAMWSRPTLRSFLFCYGYFLSFLAGPLAAVLAIVALWRILPTVRTGSSYRRRSQPIPLHEIAAAVGLFLFPFVCLLQAVLVTHQIAPRYALPLAMGIGILFAFTAYHSCGGDAANGLLIALILLGGWGTHLWSQAAIIRNTARATREFDTLAAQHDTGLPIVISDGSLFFQLVHYTSSRTSSRLYYLADPELASQYTGSDSLDLDLLAYSKLTSLQVTEARPFLRTHTPFLLYVTPDWNWILWALKDRTAQIQFVDMTHQGTLYRVVTN